MAFLRSFFAASILIAATSIRKPKINVKAPVINNSANVKPSKSPLDLANAITVTKAISHTPEVVDTLKRASHL